MKQVCDICKFSCISPVEYVRHFELNHKFTGVSLFRCGIESCYVRFQSLKRYEIHFREFHLRNTDVPIQSDVSINSQLPVYKCAFPLCTYTCKSKTTMRTHRFWNHSGSTHNNHGRQAGSGLMEETAQSAPETENLPSAENMESLSRSCSGPVESSISDDTIENEQENLAKKFVNLYLTLNSKLHVPDTVLQFIINSYSVLLKESFSLSKKVIEKCIIKSGLPYDPKLKDIVESSLDLCVAEQVHSSQGPLRSSYIRKKKYEEEITFVAPQSHFLGLDNNNIGRKYHTVPLRNSLKAFLNEDSVFQQYEENKTRLPSDEHLRDIFDGSLFKSQSVLYDPSDIMLMIYGDELELFNPIGCAKSVHKVTNLYVSVVNLHPWSRTKRECLLLALTCREKDIAYFGLPKVLEPLIQELKYLEENGIEIKNKTVRVRMLMFLGDNLGTHTVTGFLENFSRAKYFCRYCEESRAEWNSRWRCKPGNEPINSNSDEESNSDEDDSNDSSTDISGSEEDDENFDVDDTLQPMEEIETPLQDIPPIPTLRTEEMYDKCVRILENKQTVDHVKGVVANCQFNNLSYFHCVQRSPPCLPHDILLGVLPHDLTLVLKYLQDKYNITNTFINRKIRSFPFIGTDQYDRPPKINNKMRVSGNAVQNRMLLRFLPLILGDKITDKSDKVWKMVLLLKQIVERISSPMIAKASLPHLQHMIRSYLHLRASLFPKAALRPKHHYLEHYPELIKIFGPLMRVSTLSFESKHPFFRDIMRAKRCCKNLTKTLANEHQLMMSSTSIKNLVENHPVLKDCQPMQFMSLSPVITENLSVYFGEDSLSSLAFSNQVTHRGTKYCKGSIVVITSKADNRELELCHINTLCVRGDKCYAAGFLCSGIFEADLGVYCVTRTAEGRVINLSHLKDYAAYPIYKWENKEVVVLKHFC